MTEIKKSWDQLSPYEADRYVNNHGERVLMLGWYAIYAIGEEYVIRNSTDGIIYRTQSIRDAVRKIRQIHRIDVNESHRMGVDGYEACKWP